MNRRQRTVFIGAVIAISLVLLSSWWIGEGGTDGIFPTPTPTATPSPSPTVSPTPSPTPTPPAIVDVTIKTVTQSGRSLAAGIYVDGEKVGVETVVFEAKVGQVYKVAFGELQDYVTPEDVTFALGPDGKLSDGTTTIRGIYQIPAPTENQVALTVTVRQATGIPSFSFPLKDVLVKVKELKLEGKTNSDGEVSFWVTKNYGTLTVTATTGGLTITRLVTISGEDVEITITYPPATLSVQEIFGGLGTGIGLFVILAIVWFLWKKRRKLM